MDFVIRGLAVYVVLLIVARLSGRRTLAQATPFDVVLLLIIAETTQQAVLGDDSLITNAVVLIVTLFGADVSLVFLEGRSARLALWLDGAPTVLISRGKIDAAAFRRARVSVADVLEAARMQHGVASLARIDAAVLETSGGISIILKDEE